MEMTMLERLTQVFREVDDFCQAFNQQRKADLLDSGAAPRGPKPGLSVGEIITLFWCCIVPGSSTGSGSV
jgi:hypothetical protein